MCIVKLNNDKTVWLKKEWKLLEINDKMVWSCDAFANEDRSSFAFNFIPSLLLNSSSSRIYNASAKGREVVKTIMSIIKLSILPNLSELEIN